MSKCREVSVFKPVGGLVVTVIITFCDSFDPPDLPSRRRVALSAGVSLILETCGETSMSFLERKPDARKGPSIGYMDRVPMM